MADYPKIERGLFHLLPQGWCRKDQAPYPEDRLETWTYELEIPTEDAKERICLIRTWKKPDMSSETLNELHARFGEPVLPTVCRNVTFECEV